MMAISLWQPWATAMALSEKTIETRSWPTRHRGLLAIHAAQKLVDVSALVGVREFAKGRFLPLGAVLAVVSLDGCKEALSYKSIYKLDWKEAIWGNFEPGRWCWTTSNLRPMGVPILCRGRQGLFKLPADVEAAVKAQL
jgi:hypothetical protein